MSTEVPRGERAQRYDLHALFQASRMLNSSLDLDYVLRNLVLSTMSKLLVTRSAVLLHEPAELIWRVALTKGLPKLALASVIELQERPGDDVWTQAQVPPVLANQGIVMVMSIQSGQRHATCHVRRRMDWPTAARCPLAPSSRAGALTPRPLPADWERGPEGESPWAR